MKNKVWIATPVFAVFSVFMLVMSCISFKYNRSLAITEIAVSVILLAAVSIYYFKIKKSVKIVAKSAFENIAGSNTAFLERFKMPVAVVGQHNDILWCNTVFANAFKGGKSPLGDAASVYFPNKSLKEIISSAGTSVKFENKKFTVFANEIDGGAVLYYIDDTGYKNIALEYSRSRPTVAIIHFDNIDDFIDENDADSSQTVLSVENAVQKLANNYKALYKKLSSGRYMVIFQERNIQKLIAEKFKILDEVRSIKYDDKTATVSIGIGRGAPSVRESEVKARMALNMALGRGGDQVAINKNDNYEFFGGVSQGVEKRSKVKTRVIANYLQTSIESCDKVIIMGHKFSDFDCVGAAIGLQSAISTSFSKPAYIAIDKNKTMAAPLINMVNKAGAVVNFIDPDDALHLVTEKTLLVVVDTHIPERVESQQLYSACKSVVVIDHHRKMVNYINNAVIFYHETTASSASEMVTELITYMTDKGITPIAANALLAGIMLDTKNFIIRTGVRTFEAAGYLRRKGADTVSVKSLFSDSLVTYKERYRLVSDAQIYKGCAVAVAGESLDDSRLIAAQAADELLGVKDVIASFVIFVTEDNVINISARSYGKLNVQVIMEALGGGGHQTMAATQIKDTTLESVRERLVEAIDEAIN